MIATNTRVTRALYCRAVKALGESHRVRLARSWSQFPPVQVWHRGLRFEIRHAWDRRGTLYLFPDGKEVLLPGWSWDEARAVVQHFARLLEQGA